MFRVAASAAAVAVGLYAWWATGLAPFHAAAYVSLVATAAAVLVVVVVGERDSSARRAVRANARRDVRETRWGIAPWVGVAVAGVALEAVGLAAGGHSPSAPTLSTTVDHLLAEHWERWLLYGAWLALGAGPAIRRARRRRSPRWS